MQRLVCAVLKQEPSAQIKVDNAQSARPWFRFGSGSWGQALYLCHIANPRNQRSFSVYAIPTADGDSVPVLVGMTFLGPNGAIIDLGSGHIAYAAFENHEPQAMPVNERGHYMIDLAGYLCDESTMHADRTLSAVIHVRVVFCG